MNKRSKNGKPAKPSPSIEIHLRIFDTPDRALALYIKQEAHANDRSDAAQIRFMLRKAFELSNG